MTQHMLLDLRDNSKFFLNSKNGFHTYKDMLKFILGRDYPCALYVETRSPFITERWSYTDLKHKADGYEIKYLIN